MQMKLETTCKVSLTETIIVAKQPRCKMKKINKNPTEPTMELWEIPCGHIHLKTVKMTISVICFSHLCTVTSVNTQ